MKQTAVSVLLIILVNLLPLSASMWMTFDEFFSSYQRLDEAHIIDIPDKPCPANMRRIALGDCRKTY